LKFICSIIAHSIVNQLITVTIARSARRRYLIYSEADFEIFRPGGGHVAPIGVKFGATPNFTPIGATIGV